MRGVLFFIVLCVFAWADLNQSTSLKIQQKVDALDLLIENNTYNLLYENFIRYKILNDELNLLKFESEKKGLRPQERRKIQKQMQNLEEQLKFLKDYKDLNFAKSLGISENVEILPKLTNPLAIIGAFSHIKKLEDEREELGIKIKEFESLVDKIDEKIIALKELIAIKPSDANRQNLKDTQRKLTEFQSALQLFKISFSVYEKKIEDEIMRVNAEIKIQTIRAINILLAIALVVVVSILLKFVAKRYIKDNERYYTATKVINFININIIFIILLFAYIENITYLVTILGFASAGLAIAMKDMFMSMLGWCVIVFGGSFRVGDRIKVMQNDHAYVGDIIDISFLRITLYETITLETYMKNRRSGRVIFIPNNYVFTQLISNYTHHGMRTVYDGIDVTVSFDSNLEKAQKIIEQIVLRQSKPYTELAKKTMRRLQNEYSIRNSRVEPSFFVFFEHWGMRISAWYMTNAYSALTLRSNISKEIMREFQKHEDIKIAYPSQNLHLDRAQPPLKTGGKD
ncbi:mechanosensitive ion channel domain-containing protein [Campylobacter sp.]|uniref:mechanosensitive ion channel family protein n=1 Tax=Campylobacter sp. TaxID=205 RepID=UPI0026DD326E|nr:mechanosensitive ion channel domain-containing protein [Campylobacter sp.]MDO4673927.1 mechanosensitive ion channel [Campylobacter sp.]